MSVTKKWKCHDEEPVNLRTKRSGQRSTDKICSKGKTENCHQQTLVWLSYWCTERGRMKGINRWREVWQRPTRMEDEWRKNVVWKEMEQQKTISTKIEGRKIRMVNTARKQGEYKDKAWWWVITNHVSNTEVHKKKIKLLVSNSSCFPS